MIQIIRKPSKIIYSQKINRDSNTKTWQPEVEQTWWAKGDKYKQKDKH